MNSSQTTEDAKEEEPVTPTEPERIFPDSLNSTENLEHQDVHEDEEEIVSNLPTNERGTFLQKRNSCNRKAPICPGFNFYKGSIH